MIGSTHEFPLPFGRRERRKLEVRTRIYTVARELSTKQGFDATTVDEIARVANVASATFFNHFHNKQALLEFMRSDATFDGPIPISNDSSNPS